MPASAHGAVQTDAHDGRKFITIKVGSNGKVRYRKVYLRTRNGLVARRRARVIEELADVEEARAIIKYLADSLSPEVEKRRLGEVAGNLPLIPALTHDEARAELEVIVCDFGEYAKGDIPDEVVDDWRLAHMPEVQKKILVSLGVPQDHLNDNPSILADLNTGSLKINPDFSPRRKAWEAFFRQPVESLNTWTHVALTYDQFLPTDPRIFTYVNGELVHSANGSGPIGDDGGGATDDFQIGNRQAINWPFAGRIDEVRVWSIARSQAQIREGTTCPPDLSATGLAGYWPMDEGAGAADDLANGNFGSLTSGAAWFATGASDCNANGVPDECELANNDCNTNGVPDTCESDWDGDLIPDACDPCAGGAASGDSDASGIVDFGDYADLEPCVLGPGSGLSAGCECFDFDSDGDNDLKGFAVFQTIFSP